jgi:predicted ATPase
VFVGRDAEHAEVTDALVGWRRRVVIIEGEVGVGKTRLIAEVLAGLPARQERMLVTRCPPMRVPFTLGALVETISRLPGDAVEFGPLAGALRPDARRSGSPPGLPGGDRPAVPQPPAVPGPYRAVRGVPAGVGREVTH